jgi:hypothetical protein
MHFMGKFCVVSVIVVFFWSCVAQPTEQRKDLVILPHNNPAVVQLRLDMSKSMVLIGEEVTFSFEASQNGCITLWDIGTSGRVQRIYPRDAPATCIKARQRYGAGGADIPFTFVAHGPLGIEQVYLIWTRTREAQPPKLTYSDTRELSKDLQAVHRLPRPDWATAQVAFAVTAPGQEGWQVPVQTTVPHTGAVYLLALGANVGELTKANIDVQRFAGVFQSLLAIPAHQIRVRENATTQDFSDGMNWLQTMVKPGDLVLFLFSGHGYRLPDNNGDELPGHPDGLFVFAGAPLGADPTPEQMVRDDEFARRIEQLPTTHIVAFIDACFSTELLKSPSEEAPLPHARIKRWESKDVGLSMQGQRNEGYAQSHPVGINIPTQGLFFAAAQGDEAAYEVDDGGLFITTFLQELQGATHGNFLTVFDKTLHQVRTKRLKLGLQKQNPIVLGDIALGHKLQLLPINVPSLSLSTRGEESSFLRTLRQWFGR